MTGDLGNGSKRDLTQKDALKFHEAGLLSSLWQRRVSVFVKKQGAFAPQQVELGLGYCSEAKKLR